jgi:hypothetical protein
MIVTHAVAAGLKVRLGAAPPSPSPKVLERVASIWDSERAKRGEALFNGNLFSIDRLGAAEITGWLAEYRWFLAQRRDPALRPELRVNPLGVTGILCCAEGVVFGRRAQNVEMDAGLWELVPSGGVDGSFVGPSGQIDLAAHLLAELREEIGILATEISAPPTPIAEVEDRMSHVTDVALIIEASLSAQQIKDRFSQLENQEYLETEVVPFDALSQYVKARTDTLAAVSQALIAEAGPTLLRRVFSPR